MSAPDAVLGIDLGTSLVKAGVYTEDGQLQATGCSSIALRQRGPGHVEQDLDEFYATAASATRRCLSESGFDPRRIGGIAVAGQMAGVGIVDRDHRPLAPFDSWLDTRCADVVDQLTTELGGRITATAGCAPTISFGPKMVWWRRHRPDVCAKAAAFVTAAGYVAARAAGLQGRQAFIDPSYLHFTAVADSGTGSWDAALVRAAGADLDLLPSVVESTSLIGELTASAAADFGLPVGVPIAAGCGDTAASALGSNVTEPGQGFDVAGTAAVFGVCLPTFAADAGSGTLMTMRAALPGRWYSLAYVGGAGQVIEWVCRELLGLPATDQAAYAELALAAAAAPAGSDGVVVSPHFSGRIAPVSPSLRGTVIGLSPRHGTAHLARATLESIAFEYLGYLQAAQSLVPDLVVKEVVGTGGGSRSDVWNQIKADVLNLPYRPVVGIEPEPGAAIVAMVALGRPVPPLDPSASAPVATPNPRHAGAYSVAYERYRAWTELLIDGYRRLAPGLPLHTQE